MVDSVPGEVIAAFAGVAICAPYFYQCQSLLANPVRSPLRAVSWHLWTVGFLGMAAFFGHVPGQRASHHKHHRQNDVPGSPRMFAVDALVACALCQLCWSLDHAGPSRHGRQRVTAVVKLWIPGLVVVLSLYFALGMVHESMALYNSYYRKLLAIIAFVMAALSGAGSVVACMSQSASQLRRGGLEVAGLYWMPMAMQALGFFTGIIACVLVYVNVEWYGTGILGTLLGFDLVYIVFSRLKSRGHKKHYETIPLESTEDEMPVPKSGSPEA